MGRVFRLVPAHTDAVRGAAESAHSPAAELAASLLEGPPHAVMVEVTWFFGHGGRDAACAWRQALRTEVACEQLEGSISAVLSEKGAASCELVHCSTIAVALLDDAPHAALDKKRVTKRLRVAIAEADSPSDARSTGLAPAVASRLGAVLMLARTGKEEAVHKPGGQLHDAVQQAPTPGEQMGQPGVVYVPVQLYMPVQVGQQQFGGQQVMGEPVPGGGGRNPLFEGEELHPV